MNCAFVYITRFLCALTCKLYMCIWYNTMFLCQDIIMHYVETFACELS